MFPKFVDHHPKFTTSGYAVTNEEPELFNKLLSYMKFPRIATIASGGEVLFTVLLRRAREVVAVDHSYGSLTACYTKALLLQRMPARKLQALLETENYETILGHIKEIDPMLPEQMRKEMYYKLDHSKLKSIRQEWGQIGHFHCSKKAVGNVTFVHGDLRDLRELYPEPFDLLYISNALEHQTREYKKLTLAEVAPLLAPNGLLLFTEGTSSYKKADASEFKQHGLEMLNRVRGYRSSWYYCIARRDSNVAPVSVPTVLPE